MKIREKIIIWLKKQSDWTIAGITSSIIVIPAIIVGFIFGK